MAVSLSSGMRGALSALQANTLTVQQTQARPRNFIQQLLTVGRMLTRLVFAQETQLPVGGGFNDLQVFFEIRNPEQTVMVRRLLVGRNSQPLVIRVKACRHLLPVVKNVLKRR